MTCNQRIKDALQRWRKHHLYSMIEMKVVTSWFVAYQRIWAKISCLRSYSELNASMLRGASFSSNKTTLIALWSFLRPSSRLIRWNHPRPTSKKTYHRSTKLSRIAIYSVPVATFVWTSTSMPKIVSNSFWRWSQAMPSHCIYVARQMKSDQIRQIRP